jgi:hypothetical protein
VALGLVAAGCHDQTPGSSGHDFISDAPNGNGSKNGGEDASGAGGGGGSTQTSTGTGGGDAQKAIIEADIVQVQGDQLFALSQYGGLSIVDMSDPAHMSILGRYRVQGVPFEMYLQDNVVYAMFSSFGQWQCDGEGWDSCTYVTSSHIEALDISNPASIAKIGSFDLPGEISDSRIVGDVLYAVSYEDGYCWNCQQNKPETVVTSIKIGDPQDIAVVDSVSFEGQQDQWGYGWWKRSVSVTQDRMYVAGVEWSGSGEGHSTIQIVDISDPAGQLHVGASVQAAGEITSRWQMDEKDGYLRVISQPGVWWQNGVPEVQTFKVDSSDSISPVAKLDLVLPKPESLRSARFDGNRLFAITAEQMDPLWTIDLTNPAQPAQVGKVELPGWIYYLEPRGDRLFALGFDQQSQAGSMNVSLFDVADLANPSLIQRVNFGGTWSWPPEDQDRIHKAFKIDDTLGAIFVPYGAYVVPQNGDAYGCGKIESGVQIVDFTHDSLTKRGSAPLAGFARRALMHNSTMFTVSDSEVGSYDIANRDAPSRLGTVALSTFVDQSIRVGDKIVRVASDWWTNAARLDVVPDNDPGRAEPLGKLDLTAAVGADDQGSCYGWGYFYGAQLFALDAQRVALAWSSYGYDGIADGGGGAGGGGKPTPKTSVVVVNVSNPSAPVVEGKLSMPFSVAMWGWWGTLDGGKSVVQVGSRLVFRRIESTYDNNVSIEHAWLEVVDLSNPASPQHTATIPQPDGFGHSLLVKNGDQVLTSHWEPVPGMDGKVRFYLDQTQFPAFGPPLVGDSVNVPGALLSFDPATSHVLTMDFHRSSLPGASAEQCYQLYGGGYWYDEASGSCSYLQRTLKLVNIGAAQVDLLDSENLAPGFDPYNTQVTEDRVFAQGWVYNQDPNQTHYRVLVIGDIGGNQIQTATKDISNQEYLWAQASHGYHLILASYNTPGIHDLDATDLANITVQKKGNVNGWVYSVSLDNDRALCSMGPYGLDVIDLQ